MAAIAHVKTFLSCDHGLQNTSSQVEHRPSEILVSSKIIRHTKVEILRLKSCFLRKKEQNFAQIFERHFQLNYPVGVRDGFTLVCVMTCIRRVNRFPDPVLRGQPCRSCIKNFWCLSSLLLNSLTIVRLLEVVISKKRHLWRWPSACAVNLCCK